MASTYDYHLEQATNAQKPLVVERDYQHFDFMPNATLLAQRTTLNRRQANLLCNAIHRAYGRHNIFNVDIVNAALHLLQEGYAFRQIMNWTQKRWLYVNYCRHQEQKKTF